MRELAFQKVEGLGNDFLLVDLRDRAPSTVAADLDRLRAAAPAICDRRRGVGGDGLLLVGPGDAEFDASMIVINHDGSRPEMCGNGLRCVAWFVAHRTGILHPRIATDDGIKTCVVEFGLDRAAGGQVEVDMGPGRDLGLVRPAAAAGRAMHAVSMGNPHAVAFVDAPDDPQALARSLGPGLEVDPEFPHRTNVEFARIDDDGGITLWVWERGCGITDACGTGACATAWAAARAGKIPFDVPVPVRLPGGTLEIRVPSDGASGISMRGPARVVFSGRLSP